MLASSRWFLLVLIFVSLKFMSSNFPHFGMFPYPNRKIRSNQKQIKMHQQNRFIDTIFFKESIFCSERKLIRIQSRLGASLVLKQQQQQRKLGFGPLTKSYIGLLSSYYGNSFTCWNTCVRDTYAFYLKWVRCT